MKNLFYKTGIDITKDKSMFNFLHNHFRYFTMNSWNLLKSVANNVKLYNLNLRVDWREAYNLLNADDYTFVSDLIQDFNADHPDYFVAFNGRSSGYLVLYNKKGTQSILPDYILEDYNGYKQYCKDYGMTLKENRSELVYYTRLVQDFDRLCDTIRDTVELETIDYIKESEDRRPVYEIWLLGRDAADNATDFEHLVAVKYDPKSAVTFAASISYEYIEKLKIPADTKRLEVVVETTVKHFDEYLNEETLYSAVIDKQ